MKIKITPDSQQSYFIGLLLPRARFILCIFFPMLPSRIFHLSLSALSKFYRPANQKLSLPNTGENNPFVEPWLQSYLVPGVGRVGPVHDWLCLFLPVLAAFLSLVSAIHSSTYLSTPTLYQPTDQIGAMWVSLAHTHTHTLPNLSGSSAPSDQLNLCICLRRMPLIAHWARIQKTAFETQLDV